MIIEAHINALVIIFKAYTSSELLSSFWKCNFPMNPDVRLLVIISLNRREVTLPIGAPQKSINSEKHTS